ncbi:hypothetical protein ACQKWADRAFT_327497 [Trichoderma austrokoningii]
MPYTLITSSNNSSDALQMTWEDDDASFSRQARQRHGHILPHRDAVDGGLAAGTRCYYLVDGQIREVQYDGSN